MKKKKILYALESAGGGTLKHVTCLATRLEQGEFDITVVLPDEQYEKDTKTAVLLMREKGVRVDIICMAKQISFVQDIRAAIKIYSYLKENKFDIVHAHSSKAGALFRITAQWAKIQVVIYTPHCFYFAAYSGFKRRFYAGIERLLAKWTHGVIISGTEQTILYQAQIRPVREIAIIDNAIDPDEYSQENRQQIRRCWNIPDNHKIVVGVGRLVKQKNWEAFLTTARMVLQQNPAITFIIAGEGPCRDQLSERICNFGIASNVQLCGHWENIGQIYSIADVFVSTSRWEGLPYTYLEALFFKVPLLITYTEGMEYFSNVSNAICVPQNDLFRLCDEMLKIISTDFTKETDGMIYPFTIKRFVEQHQALYRRLT